MNIYPNNGRINKNEIAYLIRQGYSAKVVGEKFVDYLKQEFSDHNPKTISEIGNFHFFMGSDIDEIIPRDKRNNGQVEHFQNLTNILEGFVEIKKGAKEITDIVE